MATLNDGLTAFYNDLRNQGLLEDTLVLTFSEFGRRISENGSQGTDHGAAAVMMVMGGRVNGGLYGTAPNLNLDPGNPTLENGAGDVRFETDFRSVYAQIIDGWLGGDSRAILGADFRKAGSISSRASVADRHGHESRESTDRIKRTRRCHHGTDPVRRSIPAGLEIEPRALGRAARRTSSRPMSRA